MKALTIRQPWAWAIVTGIKAVENRSYRTAHRGPFLIHAGSSRASLTDTLPDGTAVPGALAFGCLVGTVELTDCVRVEEVPPGPFVNGPWCWLLANPRPLRTSITYVGRQRLFDVPDGFVQNPVAYLFRGLNYTT
jgi:hypothetical protein